MLRAFQVAWHDLLTRLTLCPWLPKRVRWASFRRAMRLRGRLWPQPSLRELILAAQATGLPTRDLTAAEVRSLAALLLAERTPSEDA